jgi:hypothetical protein
MSSEEEDPFAARPWCTQFLLRFRRKGSDEPWAFYAGAGGATRHRINARRWPIAQRDAVLEMMRTTNPNLDIEAAPPA